MALGVAGLSWRQGTPGSLPTTPAEEHRSSAAAGISVFAPVGDVHGPVNIIATYNAPPRRITRLPDFLRRRWYVLVIFSVLLLLVTFASSLTIDRGRGDATLGSSDVRSPPPPSLSPGADTATAPSKSIEGAEPLPKFASGPPPTDYTLKKAELRSYFCPEYGALSNCTRPEGGYAVLIVWLLPAGTGHSSDLGVETDKLVGLDAFVIDPAGNPMACTSSGGESDGGAPTELYLLFVVPDTAKNFTLVVRNTTWLELHL